MNRINLLVALVLLTTACSSSTPTTEVAAPVPSTALPSEGQRFDPPVDVSEIPVGAWMCDMGTVHFAAGEKHDGKCPVCAMNLTQKK